MKLGLKAFSARQVVATLSLLNQVMSTSGKRLHRQQHLQTQTLIFTNLFSAILSDEKDNAFGVSCTDAIFLCQRR